MTTIKIAEFHDMRDPKASKNRFANPLINFLFAWYQQKDERANLKTIHDAHFMFDCFCEIRKGQQFKNTNIAQE